MLILMKIRLRGSQIPCGQTDTTEQTVAFREFSYNVFVLMVLDTNSNFSSLNITN